MASENEKRERKAKKRENKLAKLENLESEAGIIYLSRIPTYMGVKHLRHLMSQYGEIGRIFLKPSERQASKSKRRQFSEGWVEFLLKKKAKRVAASLNNQQVGGKKRNPWYWELWNMKYLPKFKWGHLHERLAYERAVHSQRMRTEIAQVKRESNFHIQSVEMAENLEKKEKKLKAKGEKVDVHEWEFTQKKTEDEILQRKRKLDSGDKEQLTGGKKPRMDSKKPASNKNFLRNIFSGGVEEEDGV